MCIQSVGQLGRHALVPKHIYPLVMLDDAGCKPTINLFQPGHIGPYLFFVVFI